MKLYCAYITDNKDGTFDVTCKNREDAESLKLLLSGKVRYISPVTDIKTWNDFQDRMKIKPSL